MRNVYVDMDQTLNELWKPFIKHLSIIKGKKYHLKMRDFKTYQIVNNFEDLKNEDWFPLTNQIFNIPNFWLDIPVRKDAIPVLEKLQKDNLTNLYIVTAPWVHYLHCTSDKILWLKKHFPFIDPEQIIFMKDKFLLRDGIIIDDAPKYLSTFKGLKIAIDFPYNRDIKVDLRAKNWKQIERFLGL